MMILKYFVRNQILHPKPQVYFSSSCGNQETTNPIKFETVYKFPFIKYFSLFNRLKVYHIAGTSVAIPCCGILEMLSVLPDHSFLTASYIGVTAAALLSAASLPFKNIIGFLYISEDNSQIKISSIDYWGRRQDKLLKADDWIPLFDMSPKTLDAIFLTPELRDGTKYKLFLKFGQILNSKKMGQVLE